MTGKKFIWTYDRHECMGEFFYEILRNGVHMASTDDRRSAALICSMLNRTEEQDSRGSYRTRKIAPKKEELEKLAELRDEDKPGCFGAFGSESCMMRGVAGCAWVFRCKQSQIDT